MCKNKTYIQLIDYLMESINNLAVCKCDFAALFANILHIVFDKLKEKSPIPLISIVEATCDETVRRGLNKVGLLGTIFTMTGEFFREPFYKNSIDIVIPKRKK